ncbi:hypothetical protein AAMO2058_001139200 [Amorphochlora amoebiformis]
MPRYYNPSVKATDGTDHAYRQKVVDRYTTSASAKKTLKSTILVFSVMGAIAVALAALFPSPSIKLEFQASLAVASTAVPALLVYTVTHPKLFSTTVCNVTAAICIACSLGILALAGLALSKEQGPETIAFSTTGFVIVVLNGFTARTVRVFSDAAGYRKKN